MELLSLSIRRLRESDYEESVLLREEVIKLLADRRVGDNPDFNLSNSPANELFRVVNTTWPEQYVFLPLDDPLFSTGREPHSVSGDIFVSAPKDQYAAVLLSPLAHREFVGD